MVDISFWIYFNLFIVAMLALDLGLFNRKNKTISFKKSILMTFLWIGLALVFNYIIYQWQGSAKALDFLAGYLIEKSLSVDNIFIILLIFQYFAIPTNLQHKVLLWGVLGALVMRTMFIFLGIEIIGHFHWVIYVFGAILVYTGLKLGFKKNEEAKLEENSMIRFLQKVISFTPQLVKSNFFTKIDGKRYATPLFLCLIVIEATDLVFAIDSIPAVLAITTDRFIVYTSNVFAILGLRSLYFALAGLTKLFTYLHYALAFILLFVGTKMVIVDFIQIPTFVSLLVIVIALSVSILCSFTFKKHTQAEVNKETAMK